MERAEARKLQPHFIGRLFHRGLRSTRGVRSGCARAEGRFEIRLRPLGAITRPARHASACTGPLQSTERITFVKDLVTVHGKPLAALVVLGIQTCSTPLLDLILEQYR